MADTENDAVPHCLQGNWSGERTMIGHEAETAQVQIQGSFIRVMLGDGSTTFCGQASATVSDESDLSNGRGDITVDFEDAGQSLGTYTMTHDGQVLSWAAAAPGAPRPIDLAPAKKIQLFELRRETPVVRTQSGIEAAHARACAFAGIVAGAWSGTRTLGSGAEAAVTAKFSIPRDDSNATSGPLHLDVDGTVFTGTVRVAVRGTDDCQSDVFEFDGDFDDHGLSLGLAQSTLDGDGDRVLKWVAAAPGRERPHNLDVRTKVQVFQLVQQRCTPPQDTPQLAAAATADVATVAVCAQETLLNALAPRDGAVWVGTVQRGARSPSSASISVIAAGANKGSIVVDVQGSGVFSGNVQLLKTTPMSGREVYHVTVELEDAGTAVGLMTIVDDDDNTVDGKRVETLHWLTAAPGRTPPTQDMLVVGGNGTVPPGYSFYKLALSDRQSVPPGHSEASAPAIDMSPSEPVVREVPIAAAPSDDGSGGMPQTSLAITGPSGGANWNQDVFSGLDTGLGAALSDSTGATNAPTNDDDNYSPFARFESTRDISTRDTTLTSPPVSNAVEAVPPPPSYGDIDNHHQPVAAAAAAAGGGSAPVVQRVVPVAMPVSASAAVAVMDDAPLSTEETNRGRPILVRPDGSIISGYLFKRGQIVKSWKQRFVVVTKDQLLYFENESDWKTSSRAPKGEMNLAAAKVKDHGAGPVDGRQGHFFIVSDFSKGGGPLSKNGAVSTIFQCVDRAEAQPWLQAISDVIAAVQPRAPPPGAAYPSMYPAAPGGGGGGGGAPSPYTHIATGYSPLPSTSRYGPGGIPGYYPDPAMVPAQTATRQGPMSTPGWGGPSGGGRGRGVNSMGVSTHLYGAPQQQRPPPSQQQQQPVIPVAVDMAAAQELITMVSEIMVYNAPDDPATDSSLAASLASELGALGSRLQGAISEGRVSDDELGEALVWNDRVTSTLDDAKEWLAKVKETTGR